MSTRPILKQYGNLGPADFLSHSVWVSCHSVDYDESWYDDTDEETFRPWTGSLPVGTDEMYLVHATFTLKDGTCLFGFVTSTDDGDAWGIIQPQIFCRDGSLLSVWFGMFPPVNAKFEFCSRLGKKIEEIFPISFTTLPQLTAGISSGIIPGLMKSSGDSFQIIT
jgi:hypothetical protein